MNCNGIMGDYPWGAYSSTWLLVEFDNGELHWAVPCTQCKSDICKKFPPDARIVGRVEAIKPCASSLIG